jgi:hypothetical protein
LSGDFLTVKVGDKAPDFTLPSQIGDNVTLFIRKMKRLAAQKKLARLEIIMRN